MSNKEKTNTVLEVQSLRHVITTTVKETKKNGEVNK